MNDKDIIIKGIARMLPDARQDALEFVYFFLLQYAREEKETVAE